MKALRIGLGVLVAGALVWLIVSVSGLRSDVKALHREVAKLAERRDMRPVAPRVQRPPQRDAGASEGERYEQALAHFRARPIDDAWAGTTQKGLEALRDEHLPSDLEGVSLGPAECRDSECILEVRWGPGQQPRELMVAVDALRVAVTEQLGGQLHGMVSRADDSGNVGQYFFHFARGDAQAPLQPALPGQPPPAAPAPPAAPPGRGQAPLPAPAEAPF